jgi:hypothetical protein
MASLEFLHRYLNETGKGEIGREIMWASWLDLEKPTEQNPFMFD